MSTQLMNVNEEHTWRPYKLVGMRLCFLIFGVFLSLVSAGCSSGGKDVDISKISESSKRSEVEALFGPPIESHLVEGTSFYIYEYHSPASFDYDADPAAKGLIAILALLTAPVNGVTDIGYLAVTYWPDGKVKDLRSNPKRDVAFLDLLTAERRFEAPAKFDFARFADAYALYDFACQISDPSEAQKWMCLAAQKGHPIAQYQLARSVKFVNTTFPFDVGANAVPTQPEEKLIKAYFWYSIAAPVHDEARVRKRRMAEEMTAEQISKAERLVAKWRPSFAECNLNTVETNEIVQ